MIRNIILMVSVLISSHAFSNSLSGNGSNGLKIRSLDDMKREGVREAEKTPWCGCAWDEGWVIVGEGIYLQMPNERACDAYAKKYCKQ